MHMAERSRNASWRHCDSYLMQCFGQECPEIPIAIGRAHTRTRIALDGVVEVGKLQRIAQKENRRVIAHQVPVAGFGIKLHSKTANIALGIGCTTLAGNSRKAYKARRFFAYLRENRCSSIGRNIVRNGECTICTCTFSVHTPFGNNFSVEVGKFLNVPGVLYRYRPANTCGLCILVIGNRPSILRSQMFFIVLLHIKKM